jgi:predicted CoA-binding protein
MPSQAIIERFLAQPNLAFVGVSRDPKQFSNAVYRRLREGGRTLYPVNAHADTIEGDRSYRRLADSPCPVDGVVVMVPATSVADVVREAVDCGIPRVWLHRGPGQKPVPAEAVQICHDHGIEVVDGACPLMFEAPVRGIHRLHHFMIRRRLVA